MTTTKTSNAYTDLTVKLRESALLGSTSNLLSWDQETQMPPKGAACRAEQLKLLAGIEHESRTSTEMGDLIAACEADTALRADSRTDANIREIRRDYDQAVRLPSSLVAEMAECASLGMDAWKDARQEDDFKKFLP